MHNLSFETLHSSAQDTLFIITFMIFPFCYFSKGWYRSQMSKLEEKMESVWIFLIAYLIYSFIQLTCTKHLLVRQALHSIFDMHFFSMGMLLIPISCTMSWTSVHSSLGTLSLKSISHFHCIIIRDLIWVIHPLPTTQEKTLHMDITRWSTPKSDGLYSLQPKVEKLYTVSKNKTGSWLWLRSWTPYCQIQTEIEESRENH